MVRAHVRIRQRPLVERLEPVARAEREIKQNQVHAAQEGELCRETEVRSGVRSRRSASARVARGQLSRLGDGDDGEHARHHGAPEALQEHVLPREVEAADRRPGAQQPLETAREARSAVREPVELAARLDI